MTTAVTLSIIVPVYDEVANLRPFWLELDDALRGIDLPAEVIFVDDGSTDGSSAVIRELVANDKRLRLIRFAANVGLTAAFYAGFKAARGAIVVTLDADLQNDPHDIATLLRHLDGFDAAVGWRRDRRDPWLKRASSTVANAVRNVVSGDWVHDSACSLRAVRRECLEALPPFQGMHRFVPTLLRIAEYRVIEVPVRHRARPSGRSKFTVRNRAMRALVDLLAVCWMMRRRIRYRVVEEIEGGGSGSSSP